MAFQPKAPQGTQCRALPLALGTLPTGKREVLLAARRPLIDLCNRMVEAAYTPDPLMHPLPTLKILLAEQKKDVAAGILKTVYAERPRFEVAARIKAQEKDFFARLTGGLAHASTPYDRKVEESAFAKMNAWDVLNVLLERRVDAASAEKASEETGSIGDNTPHDGRTRLYVPAGVEVSEAALARLESLPGLLAPPAADLAAAKAAVAAAKDDPAAVLKAAKKSVSDLNEAAFQWRMDLFRAAIGAAPGAGVAVGAGPWRVDLSAGDCAVLREIHRMALAKFSKPHWDPNGSFVVALDSRAWSETDYETLDDGTCGLVSEISRLARLLEDKANTKYCSFIELTHPTIKNKFVRIPLDVTPHLAKTLWNGGGTLASPTLVLHPDSIEMRIVASRRPEAMAWKDVKAVIGGDPGINNTLATTMVAADGETVARNLETLVGADEPTCREWLSSRVSDGAEKIDTKVYEGTPFVKAVARRAAQIDEVNRLVDAEYDALKIHAAMLKGLLGLAPEARIEFGHAVGVLRDSGAPSEPSRGNAPGTVCRSPFSPRGTPRPRTSSRRSSTRRSGSATCSRRRVAESRWRPTIMRESSSPAIRALCRNAWKVPWKKHIDPNQ